ncbi:hypothetical protein NQ315_002993 [Exocentrus adspersus]|uniref:Fanconi-associated nuclease n=1 Tax=Exocentrus adspersus TaxID=1586481 RepID=A0AAV8W463_9CUCU|nr:hypothetical protein NQ315_002993 [Exocentrus adspersus]
MRKSKTSHQSTKCNLKQTNISTVIQNWNAMKRKSDILKKELYSQIIVVEDSDTEEEPDRNKCSSINRPRKKRPLACPFSDEEDETDIKPVVPPNHMKKASSLKAKMLLPWDFSSDEAESDEPSHHPPELLDNVTPLKSKPLNPLPSKATDLFHMMRPAACSTPCLTPDQSILNNLSDTTHVGIDDLYRIPQNSEMSDRHSVSSGDSDRTVIIAYSGNTCVNNNTVIIRQNLIFKPGSTNETHISQSLCEIQGGCAKGEQVTRYLEQSETNKLETETPKNSASNLSKENSQKRKANGAQASGYTPRWLSKASPKEHRIQMPKIKDNYSSQTDIGRKTDELTNVSKVETARKEVLAVSQGKADAPKSPLRESLEGNKEVTDKMNGNDKNSRSLEKVPGSSNVPQSSLKENVPSGYEKCRKRLFPTDTNSAEGNKSDTKVRKIEIGTSPLKKQGKRIIVKLNPLETTTVSALSTGIKSAVAQTDDANNKGSPTKVNPKTPSKPNKFSQSPSSSGSPTKNSPNTSPTKVKPKKEERKMNIQLLTLVTDLFKSVFSSKQVNSLLGPEKDMIRTFFSMDVKYQYLCLKLYTWKRKWYNIFKFCNNIHLDLKETEVSEMFALLEINKIIDTEYIKDDSIIDLLQRLDNSDLKSICDQFRLKKTLVKKGAMVESLLRYCSTQSTLTLSKTTKDLLKDEIQRRMGKSMRVSETFYDAFYSTYVLATFTNSRFTNLQDYVDFVLRHKVAFPEYRIDDYVVFSSKTDFVMYVKARKYRDELETISDHLQCLQISRTIFRELKCIENERKDEEIFKDAPHLIRFTARSVYVSALSMAVNKLFAKFPDDVKTWLEFMIDKVNYSHKIGDWYNHLIWLYMRYIQPFNYDRAAELLIKVLRDKREHLSEVQLYYLRERGKQLICTRKYKILQLNHDTIAELLPRRIDVDNFPEITIPAKAMRSNDLGKKRNYMVSDMQGNKTVYKVEDVALAHYFKKFGYSGVHCEGGLVKATFTLFFFDIIYNNKRSIPGTFISKLQSEPLDMNTQYFYLNRKEEIDKRLKEIESEWSDDKVVQFLERNYEKHSHEFTICEVGNIIEDPKFLKVLVQCIGRKVLAKIYERLVKNFRVYRSGLPDLFIWNVDRKECKFVEVKGENDKLSIGQTLWLNYLKSVGAQIEVCLVHSIGSKRKIKKMKDESRLEASTPSTSTSSD